MWIRRGEATDDGRSASIWRRSDPLNPGMDVPRAPSRMRPGGRRRSPRRAPDARPLSERAGIPGRGPHPAIPTPLPSALFAVATAPRDRRARARRRRRGDGRDENEQQQRPASTAGYARLAPSDEGAGLRPGETQRPRAHRRAAPPDTRRSSPDAARAPTPPRRASAPASSPPAAPPVPAIARPSARRLGHHHPQRIHAGADRHAERQLSRHDATQTTFAAMAARAQATACRKTEPA